MQTAGRNAANVVVRALETVQIQVLAVKGLVTAATLYDDPAERPMSDVDLRILPEHVARATDIGRRLGWGVPHTSRIYPIVSFDVEGIRVELEGAVGPPGLSHLSVSQMLSRSTESDLLGFPCRFPEIHDHALHLCVNVFKDKLTDAASWALDDVSRIVRQADFSIPRFVALARVSRSHTIAWIVADYFATERSDEAWDEIRNCLGVPESPAFVRAFAHFTRNAPTSLGSRFIARVGSDDAISRARALALTAARTLELWRHPRG